MIEYKLVNAIANVESKAGDGSQGGGGSGGGTTNDFKLAVQFTFLSDDSKTHTGLDDIAANDFLFKLATTSTSETIATGTIRSYVRNAIPDGSNELATLEYIPGQSGSGDFDLICKNEFDVYDKYEFEIRSLTRIKNYDSQAKSNELTRMYFYNISDQEMSSAVGIIELAKLSLNIIFFK